MPKPIVNTCHAIIARTADPCMPFVLEVATWVGVVVTASVVIVIIIGVIIYCIRKKKVKDKFNKITPRSNR